MEREPTEDERMQAALLETSDEAWARLFDAAERVAAEAVHATWAGGEQVGTVEVDGVEKPVTSMPYPEYSEAVEELRTAIGTAGLVVPYDWMQWEGNRHYRGGEGLVAAPATDAVRLVTAIVRSERFGDGSIAAALDDGTLLAAIDRLRAWVAHERPTPS